MWTWTDQSLKYIQVNITSRVQTRIKSIMIIILTTHYDTQQHTTPARTFNIKQHWHDDKLDFLYVIYTYMIKHSHFPSTQLYRGFLLFVCLSLCVCACVGGDSPSSIIYRKPSCICDFQRQAEKAQQSSTDPLSSSYWLLPLPLIPLSAAVFLLPPPICPQAFPSSVSPCPRSFSSFVSFPLHRYLFFPPVYNRLPPFSLSLQLFFFSLQLF